MYWRSKQTVSEAVWLPEVAVGGNVFEAENLRQVVDLVVLTHILVYYTSVDVML